jgi:hypothetical protein
MQQLSQELEVGGAEVRMPGRCVTGPGRGGGLGVLLARLATEVAPTAVVVVGDVAELRHVDVDHRARVGVFVATDRVSGDPIDSRESVDPGPNQHCVDR